MNHPLNVHPLGKLYADCWNKAKAVTAMVIQELSIMQKDKDQYIKEWGASNFDKEKTEFELYVTQGGDPKAYMDDLKNRIESRTNYQKTLLGETLKYE